MTCDIDASRQAFTWLQRAMEEAKALMPNAWRWISKYKTHGCNTYRQETQDWAAQWSLGSTATLWCCHWSWNPWISMGNLQEGRSKINKLLCCLLPTVPNLRVDHKSSCSWEATHLCRVQGGCRCRWSIGTWWCTPGSSSTWARSPQWLFFCVDTRLRSANRHESWHRNPFADRLR